MDIEIVVPGEPNPQARPRARAYKTESGKWISQTYNPKGPGADYRARVAHEAHIVMQKEGFERLTGPIVMRVHFHISKPVSKPKYKKYPDVTPDLDNYVKAVWDGLGKIVFVNDSQICQLYAIKSYAISYPLTRIQIDRIEEKKK